MSYEKIDTVLVMTNESCVLLDSGDYVAFSLNRYIDKSNIVFRGAARAIYADGMPMLTKLGFPVKTEIIHSDPRTSLADDIAKDCILALLGEPTTLVEWSAQYLVDVNIRHAISLANVDSSPFDPSSLI